MVLFLPAAAYAATPQTASAHVTVSVRIVEPAIASSSASADAARRRQGLDSPCRHRLIVTVEGKPVSVTICE